jgi:hypothetical protein
MKISRGKPEAVNQKMTDSTMTDSTMTDRKWQTVQWQTVQWQTVQKSKENKDRGIIKYKSQNHQHVFNKSKLKVGKRKMILHIEIQKCI